MSIYTDRIQPTHSGISTFLDDLLGGKYQIPTFQRDVVWEKENVKKLWDSVYKFYPLGSILVWKTDIKLQNHREIGGIELPEDYKAIEYQYILDGQQRTTSLLTSLYGGKIAAKENFNPTVYIDLTVISDNITDDDIYKKRFLFWDEIDDKGGKLHTNTGKSKRYKEGLIVKLESIRSSFGAVERKLVDAGFTDYDNEYRSELRRIREVLDNYRISFIELKGIQVAEVCQIFERINQSGKPLNIFDIVVAKTFRPSEEDKGISGFYLRELIEDFRGELSDKSNFSTINDLTILQIIATIITLEYPDAGIRNITDRYLNNIQTDQIEELWVETSKSIKKTFDFFDNVLNIKGPNLIPFRYYYMTIASYFYKNKKPDYQFLEKYFWYNSFHNEDLLSNTTQLWEHIAKLQEQKENGLYSFERFLIDKDRLRQSSYSSRGRLSRAILSFYARRIPKDWAIPHRPVLSDVYYILTDKPNLHHIFPLNFIEQNSGLSGVHVNSLMNIAYLTQITNLKISDRNPLEYIKDYDIEGFREILEEHFISGQILEWSRMDEMPNDAIDQFVEQRITFIIEKLKKKLPEITFDVIDTVAQSDVLIKNAADSDA